MKTRRVHPDRCAICALAERAAKSADVYAGVVAGVMIGLALRDESTVDICPGCEEALVEAIAAHNAQQDAKRAALG